MTIYRKNHRNKLFFSSVDHLGKWWKILRFLPFKLWILPYFILTGNPIKRIRFIGKQEPFPNRFLVLWTPEKSAIHDFLQFNCIRIWRISPLQFYSFAGRWNKTQDKNPLNMCLNLIQRFLSFFLFPDTFRIQRILSFSCFWTLSAKNVTDAGHRINF